MQHNALQLPNMPGAFPPPPVASVEHEVLVDSPQFQAVLLPRWRSPEQNGHDNTTHLLLISQQRFDETWQDRLLPVEQHVTDTRPITLVAWLALAEDYREWQHDRDVDQTRWIASHKEPQI